MTEEEIKELEELTAKCIDKRNNRPKRTAKTEDLQRLANLRRAIENEKKAVDQKQSEQEEILEPLNPAEKKELAELEEMAQQTQIHNNQRYRQPEPHEMVRLGKLRKRAKVTQ